MRGRDAQRLVRLDRAIGETTWLTEGSNEGSPLSPQRAQSLARSRFFAMDTVARMLRRLANERAFRAGAGARADSEAWARLAADLASGRLQVRRIPLPVPSISPGVRIEPSAPPPPTVFETEPIEVDDRALLITRCDPELVTRESLDYTYLIRGLPSATLRISSSNFPGEVVHEVPLGSGETRDGVHDGEWDGEVTAGGAQQGRRLRPRYSPARLEIIHDDIYCDAATFTIPPLRVHALDIEDTHFNHDRAVLLPDIAQVDGSTPTLDERRITGLGVVYAALVHAEHNPEQKLLIVGHTDPSGPASYNQTLSETRAENVQLFVFGDRDGWRSHADAESRTDDIQTILAWQAARAGWDCDPGRITGTNNHATRAAIGRFQERYNQEVQRTADEGLDLPYRETIGVDNDVGPVTWGAFFDVYMHELVRLLRVAGVSEVEQRIAALGQFDSLPKFVGCGEHIPFESGRREAFADDDERERPQRNGSDRRVELLFFDDAEEPDLVCHAGPTCDPTDCPLYESREYRHMEIGVPRGLQIGEVVIDLYFEDPAGEVWLLPAGLEVTVEFDDESTQVHTLAANARLQFVTARDKSAFGFSIATGEVAYLVRAPDENGELVSELLDRNGALAKVEDGGRFFKLPERFDSQDCEWRVPDGVAFVDGQFVGLDNRDTQIGTRVAAAQVVLRPRWQHFRFEYFDRWRLTGSSVPQPRPCVDEASPLVLEGHLSHGDYEHGPTEPPLGEAVWDLEVGGETVHCLAWVQREVSEGGGEEPGGDEEDPGADAEPDADAEPAEETPARQVPDGECLVRFALPEGTFVRTDGDPDADAPTRTIEVIADGHAYYDDVSKAGVERLRYYDLPQEWWSRGYYARLSSEGSGDRREFQTITDASSSVDPYVIGLDDIVLSTLRELHALGNSPRGAPSEFVPCTPYTWEDDDEHRFTLWNAELEPYQPAAEDTYFTDVAKLVPQPVGCVVVDHPPFTRLITRGRRVFDVFEDRTPRNTAFEGIPVGARLAPSWPIAHAAPCFSFDSKYESPRADDTRGVYAFDVGEIVTLVLRCCGRSDDRELFRVAQYAPVWFDFDHPAPEKGRPLAPPVPAATALAESRLSLVRAARRWDGQDQTKGQHTIFEIGPAANPVAVGPFHALLVRGADPNNCHHYRINIVDDVRAYMDTNCYWERDDMQPEAGDRFTAAHEWGHAFGNPDHYVETAHYASLYAGGINDVARSPGCPYEFDTGGLMNGSKLWPRPSDMWHLALWMADANQSFAGATELAVRKGPYRYTTTVTPRNQDRSRFPVVSRVACQVGSSGLCDLFVYAGGVDGFNGGDSLHGATIDEPWDLIVVCRVKMAFSLSESEHRSYNGGQLFLREVETTIKGIFNAQRRLLARGTYAGRPVRARVLFSPRFISRTFPTGTGTNRTDYLQAVRGSPTTAADYTSIVDALITQSPIHAEITAVEDPSAHGITNGNANPRTAKLDTDDLEDEIVEIFGRLIGLDDPEDAGPNDYAALVQMLAPDFTFTSLEFVE